MSEYDVEFFVSLIKECPVLWDTSNDDYKNKFVKQEALKKVCKSLFPNFEEKQNKEKAKLGNSVVQRWRGIKDNFNKYEKKLKDASMSGSGSKNITEYHLYKQLQFLKKNVQNDTTTSINETENEQDNQEGTSEKRYQKQPPKRKMTSQENLETELSEPTTRPSTVTTSLLAQPQPSTTTTSNENKRKINEDLDEVIHIIKSAKRKINESDKDEFDFYGQYVASELRSVTNDNEVLQAKSLINNILIDLRMGKYSDNFTQETHAAYLPSSPTQEFKFEIDEPIESGTEPDTD